jgi:hypothetical protein
MDDRDAVLWSLVGVLMIGAFMLIWHGVFAPPRAAFAQVAEEGQQPAEAEQPTEVLCLDTVQGLGLRYLTVGRTQLVAAGTPKGIRMYQVRGYGGQFTVTDLMGGQKQGAAEERPMAP